MSKPRWTVGGADPSGNSWDILKTASPAEALNALELRRIEAKRPGSGLSNRTYFVYDAEEPEHGCAEALLEEMVEAGSCLCGAAAVETWTSGTHHAAHRCARVVTRLEAL